MTRLRFPALLSGLIAAIAFASFFVVPPASAAVSPSPTTPRTVHTLVTDGFRAGNIISDASFFNSSTMSAAEIDAFLRSKLKTCKAGYTCLKDYRQSTPNRPADSYCEGYTGGASELASTIIFKVARSCGINPQVLLVMLQKEQSLVTWTYPDATRYAKAMGQGCPDTAGCDPKYAGFFYQVYYAARQMQLYAEGKYFTWYAPGKTWNILYHPTASRGCGSSPVHVENIATSALYYYTPYQPNAAALRAGYGTGDSCSSYGNRNFYNYFKDWFGSPQGFSVTGSIYDAWAANGGATGWIGPATSEMRGYAGAGWSQQFANADIFVASGKAARTVTGPLRAEYRLVGGVASGLSWPTTDRIVVDGGAYQDFAGGRIYERSDGKAYAIAEPMFAKHESLGNVFGSFGWPTSRAYGVSGGSVQTFDKGAFYQTASNVVALDTPWNAWFGNAGGPAGPLGIPVEGITDLKQGTSRVLFSRSAVYRNNGSFITVRDPQLKVFADQEYESGPLGQPMGAPATVGAGMVQAFTGGEIYTSSSGTFPVTDLAPALKSSGGVAVVGYPAEPAVARDSAVSQRFADATLTRGTGGVQLVRGAIKRAYDSSGGAGGMLGAARSPEKKVLNGYMQQFDDGRIVCTPSILTAVPASIAAAWDSIGGPSGRLGWPTSTASTVGTSTQQSFSGGMIVVGESGAAFPVVGMTLTAFRSAGGAAVLGGPLESEQSSTAGYSQRFEKGVVFVPLSGSASAVTGATFKEFTRIGGLPAMGVATGPAAALGYGTVQPFQLGTIATSSVGTHSVRGTTARVFAGSGGYNGPLGFPAGPEQAVKDGFVQSFQGGTTYVTPVSLAVTRGVLHREYMRRGGPSGSLGWPMANETSGAGVWQQRFQHGTIFLYSSGQIVVR